MADILGCRAKTWINIHHIFNKSLRFMSYICWENKSSLNDPRLQLTIIFMLKRNLASENDEENNS